MAISRRQFAIGASALGAAFIGHRARAEEETIRVGWPAALTGPASGPSEGFRRGVVWATEALNAKGGVKGRKIEVIIRDTQGDPTKAVNAAQEMINRSRVHAIWGPTTSGEALATNPIIARSRLPNLLPNTINSLIDVEKFPSAFRVCASIDQWNRATCDYVMNIMKVKKIAVLGDTTGYGTASVKDSVEAFKARGADVVYQANIDNTQADVTPDLIRMRTAGAEAIMVWSVAVGMESRLMNTRGNMGWDVPLIGNPAMGSGEIGPLLADPKNWEKVYIMGFRTTNYDENGKLPPRTQAFIDQTRGKLKLSDTNLWWVVSGVDGVEMIAKAVEATGSTAKEALNEYFSHLKGYPGLSGDYTFSPTDHNGYPDKQVVLSRANSMRDGAYTLAPGY